LANIKNVAKAAGVSVSTVSRIINNSPLISGETRDRVLKVMKEMNYVPNIMARGLSNQQAFTVALLVNIDDKKSFSNPFFYEMMHGIETVVYKRGLCLIIANINTSQNKHDMLNRLIYEKRTQGVIFLSSIMSEQLAKELKKMNFPFVTIGEPEGIKEPIDWVDINNFQGGRQAVDHLITKGYKNIAFIGGSQSELFNKNRLSGYKSALESNGIKYRQEYVQEGSSTKNDGFEMMHKLLSLTRRPDAVICSDNILCMGAMKAIKEAQLLIPVDVGVLSFDNFPIAELLEPSLTTVDIDVFELGVQTANILFKLIDNPAARQQQSLISTCIVTRESTMREKRK
jgi:DNA-binding LacI/PurR family transcriptional regulator